MHNTFYDPYNLTLKILIASRMDSPSVILILFLVSRQII